MHNPLFHMLRRTLDSGAGPEPFYTDIPSGSTVTYARLAARAAELSDVLDAHGVGPNGCVGLLTKNNPGFFPLLFACAARGATLVPIDARLGTSELTNIVRQTGIRLAFFDADECSSAHRALKRVMLRALRRDGSLAERLAESRNHNDDKANRIASWELPRCAPVGDHQPALIVFTSGTTGHYKGVMLSHRNLARMAALFADFYHYQRGQRFLSLLPYYHINAPMITGLACLHASAHVFVSEPFGARVAKSFRNLVERYRIDVLSMTPTIMEALLTINRGGPSELGSVKYGLVGTARLSPQLWQRFEAAFGVPCYQGYGLTETTTWSTMTPPDQRKRYDSAGLPIGCEVSIDTSVGLDGVDATSPQAGEILIRGETVMIGYHRRRRLTRSHFRPGGWFATGDLGYLDRDGQLVVTGRLKNIIKRKGELILPQEIDDCLSRHPAVMQSVTVGLDDALLGEKVVSAVVRRGGAQDADTTALAEHVGEHLSAVKRPDRIALIAEVPKTKLGKVDRGQLRLLLNGSISQAVVSKLSSNKYSRAKTPDQLPIVGIVQRALELRAPICFAGFWGAANRDFMADVDDKALLRLREIRRLTNDALQHDLAQVRLIFTDVHGRVNRIDEATMAGYFGQVERSARALGFRCQYLSEIWQQGGLSLKEALERQNHPEFLDLWDASPLQAGLIKQATKRAGGDRQRAVGYAQRYLLASMAEQSLLAKVLAGEIFFSYNDIRYRCMLPGLPTFYWYPIRQGDTTRPWFATVDELSAPDPASADGAGRDIDQSHYGW